MCQDPIFRYGLASWAFSLKLGYKNASKKRIRSSFSDHPLKWSFLKIVSKLPCTLIVLLVGFLCTFVLHQSIYNYTNNRCSSIIYVTSASVVQIRKPHSPVKIMLIIKVKQQDAITLLPFLADNLVYNAMTTILPVSLTIF